MTAPAAISRLDDGTALLGDRELADLFDRQASAEWHRRELLLDVWQANRCVICGRTGEGSECDACTAGHDFNVSRSADL